PRHAARNTSAVASAAILISPPRPSEIGIGSLFFPTRRDAIVATLQEVVEPFRVPTTEVPEPASLEPEHRATLPLEQCPSLLQSARRRVGETVERALVVDESHRARHIAVAEQRLRSDEEHLGALRERYVFGEGRILLLLE